MACFALCLNDWELSIPRWESVNSVTYYVICLRIGDICWSVKHRYKDFVELNDVLSSDHGFSKDILPPKKYFGKHDEKFVETRRIQLEEYLTRTFSLLKAPMPRLLVSFLKMDLFDIYYIIESVPRMLDQMIVEDKSQLPNYCIPTLSVLQAHALRKCMKLPRPPSDIYKLTVDYSDILEFCGNLKHLSIVGTGDFIVDSNLGNQLLDFDLSIFKSLEQLALQTLNLKFLCDASDLRRNVISISVNNCGMTSMSDLVYCDQLHQEAHSQILNKTWIKLTTADMSFNSIELIGDGVSLLPALKKLDLRNNFLKSFSNLNLLKELQYLNVSNNLFSDLTSASANLKYLSHIDLSGNHVVSLKGLDTLLKLTGLNLSFNMINEFSQLNYISKLPNLCYIVLTGNPLSKIVDYRIKVLMEFGQVHSRLQLDNEESTQKELDRVAVLLAIKSVEINKMQIEKKL